MVTSNLIGGLGNYLFQIATTYSISLDNNDEMVYCVDDNQTSHQRVTTYSNNIFRKIKFVDYKLPSVLYEEPSFNFTPIEYKPNLRINGYFQSEKYFLHNKNKILELFEIDDSTENYINDKYESDLLKDTCSIHIRRGDYLRLPNHHPVCNIDYYKQAVVDIMGYDKHYLIFSDDILWCKNNFDFIPNKIFIDGNSDFQDLYLMSKCKNNIIANSSFSWWGAWLNKTKTVIAPNKWFGSQLNHNTNDLYPIDWIRI